MLCCFRCSSRFALGVLFVPALLFALSLLAPSQVAAQPPTAKLTTLSPAGGQVGTELEVKITGSDLDDANQLLFSHPGITAEPEVEGPDEFSKQPRPVPSTFRVKIAADVPPGFYEARTVGYFGMSNPRAFQVSTLKNVRRGEGHTDRSNPQELSVGSIVGGHVDDDAVDYYKLPLKAGQRVLAECFTRSIDSRMKAALVLYDPAGREVRRVRSSSGGDAVMEIHAPTDGQYVLGVHDFPFAASVDYFYRLAIRQGPQIDSIYPPVGQAGRSSKFTLYGRNLPGGKALEKTSVDGSPLQQLDVDISLPNEGTKRLSIGKAKEPFAASQESFLWRWKSSQGASNEIEIGYASAPLVVEQQPNDDPEQAPTVPVPCEFVGRFYPRGDTDWVQFDVEAGESISIEVLSHRLGLPTDPILSVEQLVADDGQKIAARQVAVIDDTKVESEKADKDSKNVVPPAFRLSSRDPKYRFTASVTGKYRVCVRDLYGDARDDPRMSYRLVIRKAQPDFQVFVFGNASGPNDNQRRLNPLALRRGAAEILQLHVLRRDGFAGEVEVVAEGLPPGVTCGGAVLGGDIERAPLVLQADANAPAAAGTFRVVGKAKTGGKDLVRQARYGEMIWGTEDISKSLPVVRMTQDLALSVIDKETAPASIQAGDGKLIETCVGGVVQLPVTVSRDEGFNANVEPKVQGLPADVQAKELKISGDDGVLEISFGNESIRPGTYTFYLTDLVKHEDYRRNPDAVEKAEQRLKQFNEVAKQLTDKQKQQKAQERKKQFEQELAELRKKAEPKDIDWRLNSSPVSVRVAATPIAIATQDPGNKRQGDRFQIPVNIERKFGFGDAVELSLEAPGGVKGVNCQKLNVAKGQSQGMLEVVLADNATAGRHTFTLRARAHLNNVQLDETIRIAFTIEPKQN